MLRENSVNATATAAAVAPIAMPSQASQRGYTCPLRIAQPDEHQRQPEEQRPVDRAPRRRPGDDGELRRAVAGEQRMRQPCAPKQQRADEEAQRVEGRATPDGHRSGSERWALI